MKAETKRRIRSWVKRAAIWTARGIIHLCQAVLGWLDERLAIAQGDFISVSRAPRARSARRPRQGAEFAAECASRRMQQRNFFKRLQESREFAEDIRAAQEPFELQQEAER